MNKNVFGDLYNILGDFKNLENVFNNIYNEVNESNNSFKKRANYTLNENDNSYIIEMDLAGVKKEDLNITVREEKLYISAERKKLIKQENGEDKEEIISSYEESFNINIKTTDIDNIKAALEDGVLTLTIPKKEEVKYEKKIEVA